MIPSLALCLLAGGAKVVLPPVIVMVPMSGELADLGQEFMRGFEMAVGDALEYEVVDTYGSPDSVLSALEVIQGFEEACLVVGPLLSATSLPAAEFSMRNRVPIILPTATDLRLGTFGSYVFPFNYNLFIESAFVLDVLGERWGRGRWAVLYPDRAEERAVVRWFQAQADTFGISVILSETYSQTVMVYDNLAKAVAAARPDVVFIPSGTKASALLFLSLRKRGLRKPVVGLDSWMKPTVASWASGALGGLYVVAPEPGDFMARALAQAQREDFVERYREKFHQNPSEVAERGYDAGAMAKEVCFDKPDRETVKKRLLHMGVYRGISGDIMVSKDPRLLMLYALKKGGFQKEEIYGKEREEKGKP